MSSYRPRHLRPLREAKDFEAQVRKELGRGEHVPAAAEIRFEELAGRFWEAKQSEVRSTTHADYGEELALYLVPYFGRLRLRQISVETVERFRKDMQAGLPATVLEAHAQRRSALSAERAAKRGNPALARRAEHFRRQLAGKMLSTRSINNLLSRGVSVFNYAIKHRLVQFNPFEHVDKLTTVHGEGDDIDQNVLSPAEVNLLLGSADTVKRSGDGTLMRIDYRLILETAVTLGVRQSKLLGLK